MTTTASASASSTHPDRLLAMAGEQLARDRWSRDRLLAYQAERLRALIAHAVAASPYYRDLLGPDAAGGDVALPELPTLPKATLMDNFDRIVTDARLRRAELEAHLSGPAARLAGIGSPSPRHISNRAYAVLLAGRSSAAPRLTVTTPVSQMITALNASGRPGPAAAALRADRLGDLGRRPQPARAAVRPAGRRRRAQRRRDHATPGRRGHGRGAPVPAAGAVRRAAGGPPVPGGARPGRPARGGGAARGGPADTPARVGAALALQLHDAGALPPPIEVTPVAELRRDPGHGAKLKLIRSAAAQP